MATQDDYIRTALRVPPGLHAQIHEAAKSNNRTFNAEIVARLQGSFQANNSGPLPSQAIGNLFASDPTAQKIFSDQVYKASMDLVRDSPEFKKEMQDLVAAALIAGQARKILAKDAGIDVSSEEVLKDVKLARQSQAHQKKPSDH